MIGSVCGREAQYLLPLNQPLAAPPSSPLPFLSPLFLLLSSPPLPPQEYTQQVKQLHTEAPMVEAQIQGFQPELVRKMASLQAVWEKFLQRVDNRRKTLHLATSYYGNLGKVFYLQKFLEAVVTCSYLSEEPIFFYKVITLIILSLHSCSISLVT